MVCVVLTPIILEVLNAFDSCCNQGRVGSAMTALLNPSLTDEEKKTLFEEFGEHLRTRCMLMCDDVHPCDLIRFYTLTPHTRLTFVEELRRRAQSAREALACLSEIENGQGDEGLIRAFIARCHNHGRDSQHAIH